MCLHVQIDYSHAKKILNKEKYMASLSFPLRITNLDNKLMPLKKCIMIKNELMRDKYLRSLWGYTNAQ